jgi:cob(I)alamin adenosyltransferase
MGKLYTKTGDKGKTGTFRGRINKDDKIAWTLGAIDELNSSLGVCRSQCLQIHTDGLDLGQELKKMQANLLVLGTIVAGYPKKEIPDRETIYLEELIDRLQKDLPLLRNFIYPSGIGVCAYLHVSRTLCRRVEREVVALSQDMSMPSSILSYLNRLSDALFVISRWVNQKLGGVEEVWK